MLSFLCSRNVIRRVPYLNAASVSIVLAATVVPVIPSCAQTVNLGDDVSRPIPGVGHDYVKGLNETVNPANGSLNVKIDLPVPKGRGLTLPFAVTYNSGELFHYVSVILGMGEMDSIKNASYTDRSSLGHGWSDTLPYVTYSSSQVGFPNVPSFPETTDAVCGMSSSYNFYDPEGGSHQLGLAGLGELPAGGPQCSQLPVGLNGEGFYTYSASGGDGQVFAEMDSTCTGFVQAGVPQPLDCSNGAPAFTVTDSAGTTYSFPPQGAEFEFPTQIEDRNGNIIHFTVGPNDINGGFPVVDTAGRAVISVQPSNQDTSESAYRSGFTSYSVGGLTYGLSYTTTSANYVVPNSTQVYPLTGAPAGGSNVHCSLVGSVNEPSIPVLYRITLPNGKYYQFGYDPTFGLLNEIDYPDGGRVTYTWGWSDTPSTLAIFAAASPTASATLAIPSYCGYIYQTPVIKTRTVYYSGTSIAQQQVFSNYVTNWGSGNNGQWTSKSTTVTTTDEITGLTSQVVYLYSPINEVQQTNISGISIPPMQLPVENTVKYYDWGNTTTPLKTDTKNWYNQFIMQSQTSNLNGTVASTTYYNWNPGWILGTPGFPNSGSPFAQLLEKDEYDFNNAYIPPSSTPSRSTTYQYGYSFPLPCLIINYLQTNPCQVPSQYPTFQHWLPIYLAMPTEVDTYNGGASGTPGARTTAFYDQGTPTGVSVISGTHDESNYSAASSTGRGNVTSVVNWLNTGNSPPTKTYTFDTTGQVRSMTDACGNVACSDMSASNHATTYLYTDSGTNYPIDPVTGSPGQTNAYLTNITDPLGFSETFTYNYLPGELTSATDENGNKTDYSYDDPLFRLTDVYGPTLSGTRPHTHRAYVDGAGANVTTTKLQAPNPTVTAVSIMDGLGQVIEAQSSDGGGSDVVITTYDGAGRVYAQTNPFASSSAPSASFITASGVPQTRFSYDALGRMTVKQNPDNISAQTWSYSANTVTITDEDSNQWKRTSDAFGRLTAVVEPNGASHSPSMETDYSYDVLGNLLQVNQHGIGSGDVARVRTFNYDSLSRLLCASNPENSSASCPTANSGYVATTTGYSYDANGNVTSRTDARGVVTNYGYDALNRLLSKTYASAPAGTMSSCYQYDAAAKGVGHLSAEWTQTGSCPSSPPSNYQSKRIYGAYDAVGRPTTELQCVAGYCTSSSVPSQPSENCASLSSATGLQYCYDLAGNLTAYTNGITTSMAGNYSQRAILLSQSFDNAGRLATVESSWNDSTHPTTLFSAQGYTAFGALSNWQLGAHLEVTRNYDNRLRVTGQSAAQQ
jgi:YD repeat-containing protein